MNSQIPRVLLISSCGTTKTKVEKLLSKNGFLIERVSQIEEIDGFFRENCVDAILCDQMINGRAGMDLFQQFQLVFQSTPFFLIMNEFDADEVMIALEVGVTNLIFPPFSKTSLIGKIENELIKRKNANLFKVNEFAELFEESLALKILMRDDKIFKCNAALTEMNPEFFGAAEGKSFEEVFDVELHKSNRLNIKRLQSGVSNIVKLNRVKCKYSDCLFDMLLFKGSQGEQGEYLIELTLLEKGNSNDNSEEIKLPAGVPVNYEAIGEKVHLTDRELQVLELSAAGLPIKVIAEELSVSNRTVEKHRANIMEKLGAGNIIEAIIAWYVQIGVIKGPNSESHLKSGVLN
ncbi:DNA-binding response regulator [Litoribacter ruber]|uniref:response regulator transcription factor n=1 Tax=Litoribacter ruber TaxID=702568 RepID=UPI001BD99D8F|nr:DNA-binding response regulator [Litoribacter ruber]MBT0809841.1 DNA-binding response regulator [Litoribacter ruber]